VLPASSQSAALLLQECLSRVAPGAAVVKSMCNLSSYMLLHGDPLTDIMKTVAASDSPEVLSLTACFAACGLCLWVFGLLSQPWHTLLLQSCSIRLRAMLVGRCRCTLGRNSAACLHCSVCAGIQAPCSTPNLSTPKSPSS
jgi:hypothetical protein